MSKTAFLFASILFFTPFFQPAALAAAKEKNAADLPDASFQVKLPDGLYMFQPKITEEVFSPLFIIKNNALIDPYAEAQRLGIKKFHEMYGEGKSFNVYTGKGLAGKLKYVTFEAMTTCDFKEILPDIRAKGRYEGRNLFAEYTNPVLYNYYKKYSAYGHIKAILTPVAFTEPRARAPFDVTDDDEAKVLGAVKGRLTDDLIKGIRERLKKNDSDRIVTGKGTGRLYSLKAIDMDNDGKKDLIGIYDFMAEYKIISRGDNGSIGGYNAALLLFLPGSGGMETIYTEYGLDPAFNLGGVIDIDGDGFLELVVQENGYFFKEADPDMVEDDSRIALLHRTASAWRKIYLTEMICKSISW